MHVHCMLLLFSCVYIASQCDGTIFLLSSRSGDSLSGQFYDQSKETLQGRRRLGLRPYQTQLNSNVMMLFGETPCGKAAKQGVCLPHPICYIRGGVVVGKCNMGFSACCSFSGSCGDVGRTRVSLFTDYGRNSTTPDCVFKVHIVKKNICQLKLEWEYLQLDEPAEVTVGTKKQFECAGSSLYMKNARPETICGTNNKPGQHLYVDVPDRVYDIPITIRKASKANWKIRIIQIGCKDENKAPPGCSQYHLAQKGRFHNYPFTGYSANVHSGYSICIAANRGRCGLRLTSKEFYINAVATETATTANYDAECTQNYLVIPGSKAGTKSPTTYCGSKLSEEVKSYLYQISYELKDLSVGHADKFSIDYETLGCK